MAAGTAPGSQALCAGPRGLADEAVAAGRLRRLVAPILVLAHALRQRQAAAGGAARDVKALIGMLETWRPAPRTGCPRQGSAAAGSQQPQRRRRRSSRAPPRRRPWGQRDCSSCTAAPRSSRWSRCTPTCSGARTAGGARRQAVSSCRRPQAWTAGLCRQAAPPRAHVLAAAGGVGCGVFGAELAAAAVGRAAAAILLGLDALQQWQDDSRIKHKVPKTGGRLQLRLDAAHRGAEAALVCKRVLLAQVARSAAAGRVDTAVLGGLDALRPGRDRAAE